ncbi:arsenate reductase ArsC [bacterium]|nr:arsenate reductase ArsC [bacterium]
MSAKVILFACVHNAGRSQMAAAFFNQLANPSKAIGISAGTQPGSGIHPVVMEVMKEAGVDLSQAKPQLLTDELARSASLLITMGCGEACPVVPGLKRDDWPLKDPKGLLLDEVKTIRDEIRLKVQTLIQQEDWN